MSKRDGLSDLLSDLPFGLGTVAKVLSPDIWVADKLLNLMDLDKRPARKDRDESDD